MRAYIRTLSHVIENLIDYCILFSFLASYTYSCTFHLYQFSYIGYSLLQLTYKKGYILVILISEIDARWSYKVFQLLNWKQVFYGCNFQIFLFGLFDLLLTFLEYLQGGFHIFQVVSNQKTLFLVVSIKIPSKSQFCSQFLTKKNCY